MFVLLLLHLILFNLIDFFKNIEKINIGIGVVCYIILSMYNVHINLK